MGRIKDKQIDTEPTGTTEDSMAEKVAKELHLAKNEILEERTLNIFKLRRKRKAIEEAYTEMSDALRVQENVAEQLLRQDETYKAFTNGTGKNSINTFLAIVEHIVKLSPPKEESDLKRALETDITVSSEGIMYRGVCIPPEVFDK